MSKLKAYIISFRLRTLPLALSCVLMGNITASYQGYYNSTVGVLAIVTTILLQILSNIANDYGDAQSGADNEKRIGPERMVASGKIKPGEMKIAIIIISLLSLVSGILLITSGNFNVISLKSILLFVLGLGAIAAAIKYTVGKNPYGYNGLGDVFVFIFFGLVGVLGTFFLHAGSIDLWVFLPASSIGFLSAAVLNLNNLRDEISDRATNKNTLVVKKGSSWAKKYHTTILIFAMVAMIVYCVVKSYPWNLYFFLLAYPLFIKNLMFVLKNQEHEAYNPHLKKLAIATFLMALLFSVGLLI